jgi:Zn-dependent peptidase ImmA (M78 family)
MTWSTTDARAASIRTSGFAEGLRNLGVLPGAELAIGSLGGAWVISMPWREREAEMAVRVDIAPSVLTWALGVSAAGPDELHRRFQIDRWLAADVSPTMNQLQEFAAATGVPFGYFLLPQPPIWRLPIPDFREGVAGAQTPSANLMAMLGQSQRRQDWYREYALRLGAEPLSFVGSAAGLDPIAAAAMIREKLQFEVAQRVGTRSDTRKALLRGFETMGGLAVATSMVRNNTHRLLDENEFRGFALVDPVAPLVFVNTRQTLNGQIFTLVHEFAHVWRGSGGIGNEDPKSGGGSEIERWCNAVASETLVPKRDLAVRHEKVDDVPLTEALDTLSQSYRCGTLVLLQALHRSGIREIPHFAAAYDSEVARLQKLKATTKSGGTTTTINPSGWGNGFPGL